MNNESEAPEDVRETRIALQVAGTVGRTVVVAELVANGLPPSSIDEVIRRLDAAKLSVPTDPSALRRMADFFGPQLQALAAVPRWQNTIDEDARLAEQDIHTAGGIPDAAWIVLSVFLGFAVLLESAKLGGHYDWRTGEGFVQLEPGLPKDFLPLAKVLSDTVTAVIAGKQGGDQPKDGRLPETHLSSPPPSGDNARGPDAERPAPPKPPASRGRGTDSRLAAPTVTRPPFREFSLSELSRRVKEAATLAAARPFIEQAFHELNRSDAVEAFLRHFRRARQRSIFEGPREDSLPRMNNAADKTWRPGWNFADSHGAPASFAIGVTLEQHGNPAGLIRRLAVRMQIPRQLKPEALDNIREFLHAEESGGVSFRWMTPVLAMSTNPGGLYNPWSTVAHDRRFLSGSPVNVAGGGAGSWTAMARDRETRALFGLTSGHVVRDDLPDGRDRVGERAYSPPSPLSAPRGVAAAGTIREMRTFPSRDAATFDSAAVRYADYALVELDPHFQPVPGTEEMTEAALTRHIVPDDLAQEGLRAVKTRAKTSRAIGGVRATALKLNYFNPATRRVEQATNMTQIQLLDGASVADGDSGGMVALVLENILRPYGMMQLAARIAVDGAKEPYAASNAIFVMPLTDIPGFAPGPGGEPSRLELV